MPSGVPSPNKHNNLTTIASVCHFRSTNHVIKGNQTIIRLFYQLHSSGMGRGELDVKAKGLKTKQNHKPEKGERQMETEGKAEQGKQTC